ncbi:hypothetical protein AAZV13_09G037100 [Glycine max]
MKTLYEMTKRVLSAIHHTWVEKLARKRKASLSRKKRKPQETLVIYSYLEYMLLALLIMQEQSTATTDGVHTFSRSHTLTELLTQPLDYNSVSVSLGNPILNERQCGSESQFSIASTSGSQVLSIGEAHNGSQVENYIHCSCTTSISLVDQIFWIWIFLGCTHFFFLCS